MARLDAAQRASLPDSAFAYVDRRGRRRLPIHDEAHVRNALARFNQVAFDDDEARDRALAKVLRAARKYRIVPVGFVASQVRSERARGAGAPALDLPSGFVTMLMTDIEGSTLLLDRLGDRYGAVLEAGRDILRAAASGCGGKVVDARADEFFAVFESPAAAVECAVDLQRALGREAWEGGVAVRVRAGIHSGYPTLADASYLGMAVHITARICAAGHGGQIVVSGDTRLALKEFALPGIRFRSLGEHRLRGIPAAVALHQVIAPGLAGRFPPVRTAEVVPPGHSHRG
jgi:class 3 adenylate cyclase